MGEGSLMSRAKALRAKYSTSIRFETETHDALRAAAFFGSLGTCHGGATFYVVTGSDRRCGV